MGMIIGLVQIKVLEENTQCSFSFHDVNVVSVEGKFIRKHSQGRLSKSFQEGVVNAKKIAGSPLLVAHANSIVFRRECLDLDYFKSLGNITGADYPLLVMLCNCGDGYYFKSQMGAYRINNKSISNSRKMSVGLLAEIRNCNNKIGRYYKGFVREVGINYKGYLMHKLLTDFELAISSRNYYKVLIVVLEMLIKCHGSQYGYRDVLWITRKNIRNAINDV